MYYIIYEYFKNKSWKIELHIIKNYQLWLIFVKKDWFWEKRVWKLKIAFDN